MVSTDIAEVKDGKTKDIFTIYSLVNLDNSKRYIGRTQNLKARLKCHFYNLKAHHHPNSLLNKDCECRFGYEVLERDIPFEKGKEREKYYIRKFKTYDVEFGYNAKDHVVSTLFKSTGNNKTPTIYTEELEVNIEKIHRLRKARGMSQQELAILIGASSKSTICHFEKEKRNCSLSTVNRIAKALGCSPFSLLRVVEKEEGG